MPGPRAPVRSGSPMHGFRPPSMPVSTPGKADEGEAARVAIPGLSNGL